MGVLDRVADLDEQRNAVGGGEVVFVAVFGDWDAAYQLHDEVGRPASVAPASRTRAMFGWSMSASAWRSASKRATTSFVSMPSFDNLEGDAAAHRLFLLGHVDGAATAFTNLLKQLVWADAVAGRFGWRSGWHRGSHTGRRCIEKTAGPPGGLEPAPPPGRAKRVAGTRRSR